MSNRTGGIKPSRFALALLDLQTNPTPSLIWTFVMGLLFFSVLGNFVYDAAFDIASISIRHAAGVAIGCVLLLVSAGIGMRLYLRNSSAHLVVSEHSNVPPMPWIITALSPLKTYPNGQTNLDNITRLLEHHRSQLQQLFLVAILEEERPGSIKVTNPEADRDEGVVTAYNRLKDWIEQQFEIFPQIEILSVYDPNSAEDSFKAVSRLLDMFLAHKIATMDQIVIDVTAGTKAMSVGLTSAGLAYGCRLSYQATKRDAEGEPDFSSGETSMVFLDSQFLRTRHSNVSASSDIPPNRPESVGK